MTPKIINCPKCNKKMQIWVNSTSTKTCPRGHVFKVKKGKVS